MSDSIEAFFDVSDLPRLRYASFASPERRYLFVETPKVACSTLKRMLAVIDGRQIAEHPVAPESTLAMSIHHRNVHPIKSLLHYPPAKVGEFLTSNDYTRFCVVRNPYARFVSAWCDKVRQIEPGYQDFCKRVIAADTKADQPGASAAPSFEQFARFVTRHNNPNNCNHHWQKMHRLLLSNRIDYTHVLRSEDLEAGVATVLARIAPEHEAKTLLRQSTINESLPVDWRSFYTQDLADMTFKFFADDFTEYGYDRESWHETGHEPSKTRDASAIESAALGAIRARNALIDVLYEEIKVLKAKLNTTVPAPVGPSKQA